MANIIGIPQEIRSTGFREFVYRNKGTSNQGDGTSCGWDYFNTGTVVTTPTDYKCAWAGSAFDNYITFTTAETELELYVINSWQYSINYNMSVSVQGATIAESTCVADRKNVFHLKLINITGPVKIIMSTSYSAVGGIGYIVV